MKRLISLSTILLVSGCASSSAVIPAGRIQRADTRFESAGGSMAVETMHESGIGSIGVAAAPDTLWALLPKVYADLAIPLSVIDQHDKVLGAVDQRVRRIGGERMSTYFRCGGSYGNNADSFDMYTTVRTQILPGKNGGSVARTEVAATAKAPTFGTQVVCSSTGKLEQRIGTMLQERGAVP